jgi:dienelactone hydrolase
MQTSTHIYHEEATALHGYLAFDETSTERRPAVLVVHDWTGRNAFACQKAEALAAMGYVGFAIDMFGDAQLGETNDEKLALIKPLLEQRNVLQARILAAYQAVIALPMVDPQRVSVIGFCFGGLCALDLARSGAPITGAVSFHGLLNPPSTLKKQAISSKILVLHGYEDPMVTPTDVDAFCQEMTAAGVDWQLHIYGQTQHAFMNPAAHDPALGTVYQPRTEHRAWLAMTDFLTETFHHP